MQPRLPAAEGAPATSRTGPEATAREPDATAMAGPAAASTPPNHEYVPCLSPLQLEGTLLLL